MLDDVEKIYNSDVLNYQNIATESLRENIILLLKFRVLKERLVEAYEKKVEYCCRGFD